VVLRVSDFSRVAAEDQNRGRSCDVQQILRDGTDGPAQPASLGGTSAFGNVREELRRLESDGL